MPLAHIQGDQCSDVHVACSLHLDKLRDEELLEGVRRLCLLAILEETCSCHGRNELDDALCYPVISFEYFLDGRQKFLFSF